MLFESKLRCQIPGMRATASGQQFLRISACAKASQSSSIIVDVQRASSYSLVVHMSTNRRYRNHAAPVGAKSVARHGRLNYPGSLARILFPDEFCQPLA
jgi:hypothetical protein